MKLPSSIHWMVPFFLMGIVPGFAAERANPNLEPSAPVGDERASPNSVAPKIAKRWFVGGNLGGGSFEADGRLKSQIESYKASTGAKRDASVYLDGYFLWRVGGKTLIGPSSAIYYTSYDAPYTTNEMNVTTLMIAFSVQHFFQDDVRTGFFGRFDAGITSTDIDLPFSVSGVTSYDTDYSGGGLRVALGYGIPLGQKLALPLMLQYQYTSGRDDSDTRAVIFTAGVMF